GGRRNSKIVRQVEGLVHSRGGRAARRCRAVTHAAFGEGAPQVGLVGTAGIHQVCLNDGVTRLKEGRVWGREVHAVGYQSQDKLVADRPAVSVDQAHARFPQGHAPDLALVVDFVGVARSARAEKAGVVWRAGRAIVGLRGVNVLEGEG